MRQEHGLGIDQTKGNRLVLMGGKISQGDKTTGSFLKVPPLEHTTADDDTNPSESFSLQSLLSSSAKIHTKPQDNGLMHVTQFVGTPTTVGCGGCIPPHGSAPDPQHKYGQCTGDYVGARTKEQITDQRLAVWALLPLAKAEPPPNNQTALVNGEYGGIALDPGNLDPPYAEWAPGKCRGYGSKGSSELLTETFVRYSKDIAGLRDAHGLRASVYTQITDCETECNGLLTYDRIMKPDASQLPCGHNVMQGLIVVETRFECTS
eukprot:COSAG02_NODE_4621_length_5155_cov_1.565467_3_plen_263_part_00